MGSSDVVTIPLDLVEVYQDSLLMGSAFPFGITEKLSFPEGFSFFDLPNLEDRYGEVTVENTDMVTCLTNLAEQTEETIAILNFADAGAPGGGVTRGARAQEEALFRCSNLAFCLNPGYYPLQNTEMLYTQGATFFKDFTYQPMEEVNCDVITLAAPRVDRSFDYTKNPDYIKLVYHKIKMMIHAALVNHVDHLILGGWGCGAYANNPVFIASVFKEVLESTVKYFASVRFAIIQDHHSAGDNYRIFKDTLEG